MSEKDDEKTENSQPKTQKKKEEPIELEGVVTEAVKGGFRVQVAQTGEDPAKDAPILLGHIAGRLRKHFIKIVPGDRVKMEVSPYDFTRGRITYRMK